MCVVGVASVGVCYVCCLCNLQLSTHTHTPAHSAGYKLNAMNDGEQFSNELLPHFFHFFRFVYTIEKCLRAAGSEGNGAHIAWRNEV